MHLSKASFDALGARVFVVGFESEERARHWLKDKGVSFPFLIDESRKVYAAYELERSLCRSLHPGNLWLHFKAFLRGYRPRMIKADPTQLGGDVIIDKTGVIRLAYYSKDPTDRPSVERLLWVLRHISDTEQNTSD